MQTAAKKPTNPPKGSSQLQVTGMINAVVDGLWDTGDRYFHDGDYVRVVSLCRICVEADQSFDEAYSSAGYLLWSMGENSSAEALLEYGTRRSKKPGALNSEMGMQLFRTNNYGAALPYLKKATQLGGVEVSTFATLGHCYTKLKKYDEAVQVWKQIVAKFPSFPAGAKNLRDAEERLKKNS